MVWIIFRMESEQSVLMVDVLGAAEMGRCDSCSWWVRVAQEWSPLINFCILYSCRRCVKSMVSLSSLVNICLHFIQTSFLSHSYADTCMYTNAENLNVQPLFPVISKFACHKLFSHVFKQAITYCLRSYQILIFACDKMKNKEKPWHFSSVSICLWLFGT